MQTDSPPSRSNPSLSLAALIPIAGLIVGCAQLLGCTSRTPQPPGQAASSEETWGQVGAYPNPETWDAASERQASRAARSFQLLAQRKVPVYGGPLFVADDHIAKLQDAQEVAKRTLVLWAVELRAEGIPQQEALKLIEQQDLWGSVSDEERRFLEDESPDPEESQSLVWRLESIWTLLWALGYIDELEWPGDMCDVPKLVDILKPREADPEFIEKAKLRSAAEILDAQDLTMRIHWAIRDAVLHHDGMVPEQLDWSRKGEPISVEASASVGVVEQRHYVLNWLVNYLDPENWDSVDTPT